MTTAKYAKYKFSLTYIYAKGVWVLVDQQVVFKNAAFGGFEKKSVLDYVYSLTQKAEESNDRLEGKVRELSDENAKMREELDAAGAEALRMRAELEGERQRCIELTELVTAREDEIRTLQQIAEEHAREMDSCIKRSNEILESSKSLEKAKAEIEQASAQIGRMIIDTRTESERTVQTAREKAEAVITEAKVKAEEIIAEADRNAQGIGEDAKQEALRMTDDAQRSIDRAYEKYSVFRTDISHLQSIMVKALEEMHDKAGQLSAEIDETQNKMMGMPPLVVAEADFDEGTGIPENAEEESGVTESPFFRYAAEE
ncbi:MAG: hypothetical protein FWH02_03680 [Oscillospiraceae bacterium]|nr:hypothetical protein [Oscillospiraceae bacterium]